MENIFLRPRKLQGNCMETGGKLKNTFLRPRKVQGNWEKLKISILRHRKVQENGRETAGKLGGNSKNQF